jgi:hypothetical protein
VQPTKISIQMAATLSRLCKVISSQILSNSA